MPEGQHFADNIEEYIDKHCYFMDEKGNELPPHRENKWISVKNSLPKEGETVLVFGYDGICSGCRHDDYWCCVPVNYEDGCILGVTHWMELPEAPKQ